jgi:hypothetical protein
MGHHFRENMEEKNVCVWIGDGEGCRCPTIYGKAYCEQHHDRVYLTLLPEMANYIIEKEVKSTLQDID